MKLFFRTVLLILCFEIFSSKTFASSENYLIKYKSELSEIENYLGNIKYLTAAFIQKSPDGTNITGKFYLSRPGKMRVDYSDTSKILIIVNNNVLIYQDLELDETSYLTTNSTPASFLTRENISFAAKDVQITEVKKTNNTIRVSVEKKNRKEAGEFSLTFELNPIKFIKMEVKNDLDQVTLVTFTSADFSNKIDKNLFIVKNNQLPE